MQSVLRGKQLKLLFLLKLIEFSGFTGAMMKHVKTSEAAREEASLLLLAECQHVDGIDSIKLTLEHFCVEMNILKLAVDSQASVVWFHLAVPYLLYCFWCPISHRIRLIA